MSFNIKNIKGTEKNYFLNEFVNAEKNGLTRIIVKKPQLMEYENILNQIFFYKIPDWNLEDGEENPMKNVWKLIDGKPHTVRHRRNGGVVEDEAGELIFEVFEGDYLPKKEKFITDKELHETIHLVGKELWRVGRYLINSKGDYGRIKSFQVGESEDKKLTNHCPKNNPHCEYIPQDDIQITISYEYKYRIDVNKPVFDEEKTYSYNGDKFEDFIKEWNVIEDTDLLGYELKVIDAKEMGTLEGFGEQLQIGTSQEELMERDMGADSTALMGTKNQDQLQLMHDNIYRKNNLSKAVQCSFKRFIVLKKEELDLILDKEKEKMELLKQDLEYQVSIFKKQMKKIQRLITTLEIYMGESENVVQIAEGENASEDNPISLRQMMLYMDEEFGDPDNGGLDFKSIEDFDKWLVDSGNYEKVIPEQKGVVVLRPRRYDKDYGLSPVLDADLIDYYREKNSKFYVLIRNGQNLYKIWTKKVEFGKRLFPLKSELNELMEKIAKGQLEMQENERQDYRFKSGEDMVEKANDKIFYYQRNFLLLQGIIMRTMIFAPIPKDFNFLDVSTHGDTVEFIYDEENTLPDGRLRYSDYHDKINQSLCKGSRILIASSYGKYDYKDRFGGYISDRALEDAETPEEGMYNLKSKIIKRTSNKKEWILETTWNRIFNEHLLAAEKYKVVLKSKHGDSVSYNFPSDYNTGYWMDSTCSRGYSRSRTNDFGQEEVEVYPVDDDNERISIDSSYEQFYVSFSYEHGWTGKKQNKTFRISKSDSQVINYDAIALEDMDYYINNRLDRSNYLHMIPTFYMLREKLREETESESHFVSMTKLELLREYPSLGELDIETIIWDAIEWWKNKRATVWKRPIAKDDSKALEMILQQVKRVCKKLGKKNINVGANYKEALLIWRIKSYTFFAFGITKKDFAEQVKSIKNTQYRFFDMKGFNKCLDQIRGVRIPRSDYEKNLLKLAKENKCTVDFKIG